MHGGGGKKRDKRKSCIKYDPKSKQVEIPWRKGVRVMAAYPGSRAVLQAVLVHFLLILNRET